MILCSILNKSNVVFILFVCSKFLDLQSTQLSLQQHKMGLPIIILVFLLDNIFKVLYISNEFKVRGANHYTIETDIDYLLLIV